MLSLLLIGLLAQTPAPSCIQGNNGRVACGYACKSGNDGVAVCADAQNGACRQGNDVVCTTTPPWLPVFAQPAMCIMGNNGRVACGYACAAGNDGVAVCADAPSGACRQGNDGHVVCTTTAPWAPVFAEPAMCIMGNNGRVACGYACRSGNDGVAACADAPNGACLQGNDGHVVCTRLHR
jgi:uncharacterized membrane protein